MSDVYKFQILFESCRVSNIKKLIVSVNLACNGSVLQVVHHVRFPVHESTAFDCILFEMRTHFTILDPLRQTNSTKCQLATVFLVKNWMSIRRRAFISYLEIVYEIINFLEIFLNAFQRAFRLK